MCVLSYKLPTPLPLLLQCRGGRRLSQVVFTQLKRQIKNRIISFFSQSTINVHTWVFRLFWVKYQKKGKNFGGREEIREFLSQVSNQISGTPFTQRNHFHLRTCFHFSLDSKRLVSFCLILIFCFDLIHWHFLLDKLKRGKQLDPVRVSLLKPLSGNGNFCRYFFF